MFTRVEFAARGRHVRRTLILFASVTLHAMAIAVLIIVRLVNYDRLPEYQTFSLLIAPPTAPRPTMASEAIRPAAGAQPSE
jgi:hypothetical protein